MIKFWIVGKKIYRVNYWRELHRFLVFVIRAYLHYPSMKKLWNFLQEDAIRSRSWQVNPFAIEQLTRNFFYKDSTVAERGQLIREHIEFMQKKLTAEWAEKLFTYQSYEIWRSLDKDIDWVAILKFEPGQRKEGMLSIEMNLNKREHLYQMIFWFAKNKAGEYSLWIGAMQGPNMANAKNVVKDITKRSHRYRTKNLILYMTQAVARGFGVKHIYAVSNEGYYANNHVRRDRKLKTDFGAFWEEAGGHMTDDERFYELPLVEYRKTMEEVPTRKRAVYRKRFAFQDDVDAQIAAHLEKIIN